MHCVKINGLAKSDWRIIKLISKSTNPIVTNNWNEKEQRFDIAAAVDAFIEHQDDEFSQRQRDLLGTNLHGTLANIKTADVYADAGIDNPQIWVSKRLIELRQFECAVQLMLVSGQPLAKLRYNDGKLHERSERSELISIKLDKLDQQIREQHQAAARLHNDMRLTMTVLLDEINAIHLAYPLHKRLEQLVGQLGAQVDILLKYSKLFSEFPRGFINSSTQYQQ